MQTKLFRLSIIALFLIFSGIATAQDYELNTISREQKLYEFSVIYRDMYYNFANMDNCPDINLDSLYREYIPIIEQTADDYEYVSKLNLFMSKFNNGHTSISPPEHMIKNRANPMFTTKTIGNKVFVDKASAIYGDELKAGDEILTINGMTPLEYQEKILLPYALGSNIEARKDGAQIGYRGDYFSFKHQNKKL